MSGLAKKIELLANMAIIALAILLGGIFIQRHLSNNVGAHEIRTGEKILLSGMDWTKGPLTLVLALQSGCHYCSESAPFYQRVVRELGEQRKVRLVAVLPQSTTEGQKYLNDLGISVDEVRQESLNSLKITGTPTLILINDAGVIVNVWRGKLTPDQESEVLSRLKGFEIAKSAERE